MEGDREYYTHAHGFIVIRPISSQKVPPLFCPVCSLVMPTADDAFSYASYDCCSFCELIWVDTNKEMWKMGWRPSQEDVVNELKKRRSRAKRLKF